MIRRSRSRYSAATGNPGSDTDALQTDVMRFMSILGLCLMAVFALVQSLPLHEASSLPDADVERLSRDIGVQQRRARALQTELSRLSAQLRSTQAREIRAQQAVSSAREQLTLIVAQTQQARGDRDRAATELAALKRRLLQARDELAGIQQAAVKKARSLRELRQRLDDEQKNLDAIDRRTEALKAQQARVPEPRQDKKLPSAVSVPEPQQDEKPASAASVPEPRGFTLRFASVDALERLVAAGTVSLYAMSGKQAWRLSLPEAKPVFASAVFPAWFHEMAAATVPAAYARRLASTRGASASPAAVVWGVQLPAAATQQIASLTRSAGGGSLVIGADGRVRLEPE